MNESSTNCGLAATVFGPAPDGEPISLTISEHSIGAQVCRHSEPDAERVRSWRAVCDTIGAAHGGTPWTYTVMLYTSPDLADRGSVHATHRFDGVPVTIWTALRDPEAVRSLLPEGTMW